MRIISENNEERIMKCKRCKSKIAYKMTDIYFETLDGEYIKCPVCGKVVGISIFDRKVKKIGTKD